MANEKVSSLPTVANALLADVIYAIQGGNSVQETLQQVFNLMLANIILHNAGNPNGAVAGVVYELCWDTTNLVLYICTTTGSASTAVWTVVTPSISGIVPPANGGTGVSSPTAHTLPVAEGSSNFHFLGPLTNGQLLIGSTGLDPVAASLSAGTGISISPGAGSIQISATGSGMAVVEVTGTTQAMASNTTYIANNAGLVTFTMPATFSVGDAISVVGKGAGGWLIAQNAGQNQQVGSLSSTVGAGGSVASTNQFDSINYLATTANTTLTTLGGPQSAGLTIV